MLGAGARRLELATTPVRDPRLELPVLAGTSSPDDAGRCPTALDPCERRPTPRQEPARVDGWSGVVLCRLERLDLRPSSFAVTMTTGR